MDITQHRNYLFVKTVSQKKKQRAVKNVISWKWNLVRRQSPSIRRHTENREIHPAQLSYGGAESGLCARLPPSFGHYTALTDIVGKDPTDQSTSWKSTTDEPSDHEPMSASPVHVWPPEFCHILFLASFFPSTGWTSTSHFIRLKPGRWENSSNARCNSLWEMN